MYTISIITPSYNSEDKIERCIQSVAKQKDVDMEHLIIDGSSEDRTSEIVKRYPELRFFSEPDAGIYDAINKGLNLAKGDFIALCHSDDYFLCTSALAKLIQLMHRKNTDFAYADCLYESNHTPVRYYKSGKLNSLRLSFGLAPAHTTLVMRRSVINSIGIYDLKYPVCGDFEYFTRLLGLSYSYLGKPLVAMSVGGASSFNIKSAMKLNRQLLEILQNKGIPTNLLKLMARYPYKYLSSKLNMAKNRLE